MFNIPFNRPYIKEQAGQFISQVLESGNLSDDGKFTKECEIYIQKNLKSKNCLLTNSCTAALEMSAILLSLKPGDEIIMPSYTFVSTANAFVLRGCKPVFVDIDKETLNLDVNKVERLITKNTRCIVPVHYGGNSCDMDDLLKISKKYNLFIIEDGAQSIFSKYKDRYLGTIGDLSTLSFHQTKNITSGEGGALLINNKIYNKRAFLIRDKGTNRREFISKKVNKYSWVDIGSSYIPSEISSALLLSQLFFSREIINRRGKIWHKYDESFKELELSGKLRRNKIPKFNKSNYHIYFVVFKNQSMRDKFILKMRENNIICTSHYEPLHMSSYGKKFNLKDRNLSITEKVYSRLVRFPLWPGLEKNQSFIVEKAKEIIKSF
tara:strand:+ start:3844 stop:4980 length:1137 start_codon:yes stop_codon:yes gene_type:complete